MAKKRDLKPEFFKDRRMGALGSQIAVVYQALWCTADDGGVARAEPELVKGEMFARWPEYTLSVITTAIQKLRDAERIQLYAVGDDLFALIPTLAKHNHIQHPAGFRHPRGGQEVLNLSAYVAGQFSLAVSVRVPIVLSEDSAPNTNVLTPVSKASASAREDLSYLIRCVVALNTAVQARWPHAMPIAPSTQDGLVSWEGDGVPVALAERVISDRVRAYRSTERNPNPKTLRYFDAAVRDAWEIDQTKGKGAPDAWESAREKYREEEQRATG